MSLNKNDMVKVNTPTNSLYGAVGRISFAYADGRFGVRFADGRELMALPYELDLVDAKREGLIQLAETLDRARQQANAIEATAHEHGIYGTIKHALIDTLSLITGDYRAALDVYASVMEDGNTVRQALDIAEVK